ncbi:MAG: phosphoribosylglycinamide formyltransferase [Xanthomonadaceae bacterium]|nr:phosphoribosylglycinamide formyltransferase [Xanthomonadaceae bacterium]
MSPAGLVVLISGRGSNALAIADAVAQQRLPARINAVIADRPADGLEAMAERGIDTALVERAAYAKRADFEQALAEVIEGYAPELIVMAGFMRVLSRDFVERFDQRMINIHPSLLPKFRGLNTHARALADGEREHGASVHWVTCELDAGPVIANAPVAVQADDNPVSLAARVLKQEHRLYPATVALLLSKPVSQRYEYFSNQKSLRLDRDFDDAGRWIQHPGG